MSDSFTSAVSENPLTLRRRARRFMVGAIVTWVVFLIVVLGSVAGSAVSSSQDASEVNGAEIAGRIIALMLMLGVPIVLGVLLTVRSSRLYKRAAAIELRDASSY